MADSTVVTCLECGYIGRVGACVRSCAGKLCCPACKTEVMAEDEGEERRVTSDTYRITCPECNHIGGDSEFAMSDAGELWCPVCGTEMMIEEEDEEEDESDG